MTKDDELLTTAAAAEVLSLKPQTLASWRTRGAYDLPYLQIGKAIRYSRRDLEAWLASRRTTATTR